MAGGDDGERWQRVSALFADALARDPAERAAVLASAAPELRDEVESLLAAHDGVGPFDRLASQMDHLRGEALESWPGSGGSSDGSPALAPGQRLGRHEIGVRLGAGGMGEVYRARDTRLQREVAIKILRRRAQRRPGSLERFEEEARAASAINHPNIVTVHDIGQGDDRSPLYIVMELVDGESLRQMLAAPWPAELLLHLAIQIADGLVAAHERGMVHGDVKPENILVSRRGIAKIVDFGLAHYRVAQAGEAAGTQPAGLLGTPGYMAPEILSGRPMDARSDQFSLGAILYEMATGEPAFTGRTPAEKLLRTLGTEPPGLAHARPDLPPVLVRAVSRCLEKDPERRYPSARELLDELRAARRTPVPLRVARVHLPAERTRLIGRQRELEEIELLVGRQVRLLTLTGPGGTGKTRLALKAAERLAPRFAGGTFFVPLASITDPALVAPTIAQAIGATGRHSLSAVIAGLRDAGAPTLLLLDNFEQVIDAAPEVSEVLAACPDVTVLVTSRQVLRLYGEHGFAVTPLALPDVTRVAAERLGEAPAVALFVERAQAANPAFALTAENAAAVAAVCAGLDGLPLALELAAAQTRLYAPEAMLARLGHRLGLLTGGARDLPGRQQTLRQTLDWSHQLLEPTEQAVFRRLGVFGGSFTVEAAQAVADPYGKLGFPIEQALAALVDKSLVQPREAGAMTDGESRFSMLETLREYALEKLAASGEDEATRRAHAAYFLVLAEDAAVGFSSPERPRWLRRFETEHDNFRGALEWLTRSAEAEWGLRLAVALFQFWERGEHLAEGRRRLGDLLALESSAKFPSERARAMFATGVLASDQGDIDAGIALCRQSLDIYRILGDRRGIVVALVALGNQHVARGDPERAREMTEESLRVWEELGDQAGFARSLSNLAFVARAQRRFAEARGLYRKAAATFERLGDRVSHAWAINQEGDVAREHDDLAAAESLYEQARGIFRSVDDSWGIASSLADLGAIARQRGDRAAAQRLYREALASFVQLDHRRGIARVLESLACLAAEEGALERGLKLAAIAGALRDRVGNGATSTPVRDELAVAVAAMHRALGLEAASRLWQEGSAMSVEEGLRLAAE